MPPETILTPVFALVMLTFVVWTMLYVRRIHFMRKNRINPQRVSTRARAVAELQPVAGPSDNLQNLFEFPVLFYVLVLLLYVTDRVDELYVVGAWVFVVLRYLHSFVHCTYNQVMHRFLAYLASSLIVWFMWARLALQIL
ncbi:MAG: hypothetical protein E2O56_04455 [Gammaproteobacteria bacterium]|nr:MAG: hypothetical protein E2O56_04455 [Gammaproteobacteria bacterium]